jgi:eukaryotic-like serine/threonine-protein kinase
LARFEREARTASALEHPNICPIYEFGEHDGRPFLVMQLLAGQTLRETMSAAEPEKRLLQLGRLLDLAIQITDGLGAAHQKGIIHRDIKPANIFVTSQGEAKILDFGLAKLTRDLAFAGDTSEQDARGDLCAATGRRELETTDNLLITRTGVAMGTAGYMSPEQVRGEKLDPRTDLFSFGLVLYEMATGLRAFAGETGPALKEAILKETPSPARQLNPGLPAKLERVITKALEKEREDRYQAASEMRADLEALKREIENKPQRLRWAVASAAVVALLIASATFWFANRGPHSSFTPPDLKLRQLTANSAENHVLSGAISPNDKYLAYTDLSGVHIQRIETGEVQTIPQPQALKNAAVVWEIQPPAWFPDSRRFVANAHPAGLTPSSQGTSIWIFSLGEAAPYKLRDNAIALSVSPDGSRIAFKTNEGRLGDREIWLMQPNGEQARKFVETSEGGSLDGFVWSPNAQRTLYVSSDAVGNAMISRDLNGGPPVTVFAASETKLIEGGFLWLADGRLMYSVRETGVYGDTCDFWTLRLDEHTGKPTEEPKRLTNWAGFCMDYPSVTANGKRLAFLGSATRDTVYLADFDVSGVRILKSRELTSDLSGGNPLDWTPDSKEIIFFSSPTNNNGNSAIYRQEPNEDTRKLIVTAPGDFFNGRVSPDGRWVFWYVEPEPGSTSASSRLMRVPLSGGSPEFVLTARPRSGLFCARPPSNLCAIGEQSQDGTQMIVTAFDPLKGRGAELLRHSIEPRKGWTGGDISPDGSRFAAILGPDDPIQIFSVRDHTARAIPTRELHNKQFLDWAANGKGLFVTNGVKGGSELTYVDLQGNAKVLWKNNGGYSPWGLQSPDGRYLAIQGSSRTGNMWTMENF